jgi:mannose-6-phosphate isomerase-like protein (cupin superfamily)
LTRFKIGASVPILNPGEWLAPTREGALYSAGRFRLGEGSRFDRHLHSDDELWFIHTGAATMLLEGEERVIRAGDIVVVPAGTPHDILAVHPEVAGFFLETGHPAAPTGHLHERPSDADGHEVLVTPEPDAGD